MNMPSTVNDTVRIEFLLRDILVFGVNLDNFVEIEKDDYQIYLFNLDSIIEAREAKTPPEIINIANDMAERIAGFVPEKTIVHSNLLDPRLPASLKKLAPSFYERTCMTTDTWWGTLKNCCAIFSASKPSARGPL